MKALWLRKLCGQNLKAVTEMAQRKRRWRINGHSPQVPRTLAPRSDKPTSKAYLSDFVKLAGILTLGSSGSCRRLVMSDCDNAGGARNEVSLATGRRRIRCSMGEQCETSASGAWSSLE